MSYKIFEPLTPFEVAFPRLSGMDESLKAQSVEIMNRNFQEPFPVLIENDRRPWDSEINRDHRGYKFPGEY